MDSNGVKILEIKQEIADTQQPSTSYLGPIEIEDDVKPEPNDFPVVQHQYRNRPIIAINHNSVGNGMQKQKEERPIVQRCTGRISVGNYRRFRDIRGDRGVRDNLGGVNDIRGENKPNMTTNNR